jgi:anti-sigma B factor antagonist
MQIATKEFKHCTLLKATGRIDSATAPELQKAFDTVIEEGQFKIVLDMSNIDFLSSAGLRVLVNAQKICKRYNRGEVVLAGVPEPIFEALDLAGFTALYKIYEDDLSAVGSM